MTFTDDPSRDYERFCEQQDHGAGDEPPEGGYASLADVLDEFIRENYRNCERIHDEIIVNDAKASAALAADGDAGGWGSKREQPLENRGAFWDGGEPVRHEELYREDLEAPGEEF